MHTRVGGEKEAWYTLLLFSSLRISKLCRIYSNKLTFVVDHALTKKQSKHFAVYLQVFRVIVHSR